MTRGSVFLLGGGWNEAAYPRTYGRFATAASVCGPARIACVLLDGEDREMHFGWAAHAFAAVGVTDTFPVYVSRANPLLRKRVVGATGIFVGGGLTPAYHDAIVPSAASWLPELVTRGVPYAGISAGAMIAADRALVAGWKLRRGGTDLVICSEELAEEAVHLDSRPGLGLAPFAIDAHASQYGSPTRVMQAVNAGLVNEGWAIDEETMIELIDGVPHVRGLGVGYHVHKDGGSLRVDIASDDGGD